MAIDNHPPSPMGSMALAAVRDAVAQQNGYITGFLAIATYVDGDGDTAYAIMLDPQQSLPVTLGLRDMLDIKVTAMATENL